MSLSHPSHCAVNGHDLRHVSGGRYICDVCGVDYREVDDCPPAGENESVPSLAAPSGSGQRAGTPQWFYSYRTARSVLGRVLRPGFDSRDEHVLRLAARVVIAGGVVQPLA